MFGRTYVRSCSSCWKEWRFKSEKEVEAFETGCKHGCPKCGGYLSVAPLPSYRFKLPPNFCIEVKDRKDNMNTKELTVTVSINTTLDGEPIKLDFIRDAVKEKIERDKSKALYKCDHRACERCNGGCDHTTDVRHAKNFKKANGTFCECEWPCRMQGETQDEVRIPELKRGGNIRHGFYVDGDSEMEFISPV